MTGHTNEATYFVANESFIDKKFDGWTFRSQSLLKVITDLVSQKKFSNHCIHFIDGIALLAIFDTKFYQYLEGKKKLERS